MKIWIKKLSIFIAAAALYVAGYFLIQLRIQNICSDHDPAEYCWIDFPASIGWPLSTAGEMLAIVGVILLFANELGFRRWWRVGRWYIPIAALLAFTIFPTSYLGVLPIDRDWAVGAFGYLLILITLIIVLWSWLSRHPSPP